MNKAILLVDMPEACNKCEFYQLAILASGKLHGTCARTNEYINPEEVVMIRSNKCPLKPIPEKKIYDMDKIKVLDCVTFSEEFYNQAKHQIEQRIKYDVNRLKAKGFNDCIDEILGEENA